MDNRIPFQQNIHPDMLDHSFAFKPISELVAAISTLNVSPVELVDLLTSRIGEIDSLLNSFLSLNPTAREEAEAIEKRLIEGGQAGPLCGIPLSIKDIILTKALPTTAGSKVFGEGIYSEHDAKVVELLRQADAIILGKTNLHEVAFGITSENEHFGPVKNPWNLNHVAGGSSGGSAAAVVSGLSFGSIGTDTRGSIRIPSACCGATGLKPTLNAVSTDGVLPLSWTLDHVGPIACSVQDVAIIMDVISQRRNTPFRYQKALKVDIDGLRIGVCPYFFVDLGAEVGTAVETAIKVFEAGGAKVVQVELDILDEALHASDIIARAEAVTIHDFNLTNKPGCYGAKVRERLSSGYQVSAIDLVKAERIRLRTVEAFQQVLSTVDCLIAPALPVAAPPLGTEKIRSGQTERGIVDEFVRLNAPQNVAGIPALVLPCGLTKDSLPIGLQLIAWRNHEGLLFSLAAHFQKTTDWHLKRPPLAVMD